MKTKKATKIFKKYFKCCFRKEKKKRIIIDNDQAPLTSLLMVDI